jgi:phosphopantetheinyl transferase
MSCTRVRVELDAATDVAAMARRHLSDGERRRFETLPARTRVAWLLGRVAVKDAVRRELAGPGAAALEPACIVIENDEHGCPFVRVTGEAPSIDDLRVSIAHKPTVAVALAATGPTGVGIDIEAVEPRSPTFERAALTGVERALPAVDDDRDAWLTRIWTVKEAAAKATGRGLRGRPRDFEIDAVDGARLRCAGAWISSESVGTAAGRFIVAWTDPDPDAAPCRS